MNMAHPQKIKYSIIRIIPRPGRKPLRFFAKSPQGAIVFGFTSYRMLTRRYRKAGLPFEVVYHLPRFPNASHVSPHFTWAEFASKKCGASGCHVVDVPHRLRGNAARLARGLEMMRALLGHPLSLLSVYRTPEHNAHVGGARYSQHMQATAADLVVPSGDQRRFVAAAKQVPSFNGIGIYPAGGVHVDVRSGPRVTWDNWGR